MHIRVDGQDPAGLAQLANGVLHPPRNWRMWRRRTPECPGALGACIKGLRWRGAGTAWE